MSFTTICPNCDARLTAPDNVRGKRWNCKKCGDPFTARRSVSDDDDAPPRKSNKARRDFDDDDEPRSRRRSSKKPKSSGPPVLLLALLGIGALLVIGGIAAAVIYFASSKKSGPVAQGPGQSQGPEGVPTKISIADWIEYRDANDRFRLKLPTQPQLADFSQETAAGSIKHKSALCARSPISYFVAVRSLSPNTAAKDVLSRELDDFPTRTPFNGTVESRRETSHQGMPGRELILSGSGERGVMRLFVVNDRLYLVMAWGMSLRPDNLEVAAVFQSLVFE